MDANKPGDDKAKGGKGSQPNSPGGKAPEAEAPSVTSIYSGPVFAPGSGPASDLAETVSAGPGVPPFPSVFTDAPPQSGAAQPAAAGPQQVVAGGPSDSFLERYIHPAAAEADGVVPCHFLSITVSGLRANSKMFLNIREDQWAVWSEGYGRGMRGVVVEATKDPVLALSSFLVNARELYLQTFKDSQEMRVNLYVRTRQPSLRGRIDLPPGASVTLESRSDRTSLIGLSSFAIDF